MITNRLRIPLAPAEGWWTLVLVAFMTVTAAWAIDDAAWVLGRGDWTDFLAWAATSTPTLSALRPAAALNSSSR